MKRIITPILLALSPVALWDSTHLGNNEAMGWANTTVSTKIARHSHEISWVIDYGAVSVPQIIYTDLTTVDNISPIAQPIDVQSIVRTNPEANLSDAPSVVITNDENLYQSHVDLHLNNHPNHHWDNIHFHGHNRDIVFTEWWHESNSSHGWHSWTQHNNTNLEVTDAIHFDRAFEFWVNRKWFELTWELFYDPKHNRVDEYALIWWIPVWWKGSSKILIADVMWPHGNMIWPWMARSKWSIFVALSKDGAWMIHAKFTLGWDNKQ